MTLIYLNFFKDYVKATENIDVDIATQPEGQKLRVVFLVDDEEKMKHIQHILTDYIINIFKPFDNLEVEFRNTSITEFDKERLLVNYQNELLTTQTRLRYGLSNIDDREQTLNNLASFIPQRTIDSKKLFEVLDNAVSGLVDTSKTLALKQPVAEARAVAETNASINITIENKFELNLSLAKLRDYLNELGKEENSISNQIEIVKDELEALQKDFQKNPSKGKLSARFKPIYESIKGFSKFGIQNIDKIIKLCEYIGELVK
jgi:hypothetical protein